MEAADFQMKVHDTGNVAIRKGLRMAEKFGSCHTGLVDGYAIEGHVPVREVKRLLRERPKAVGLAVPGMPIGSAGMDGPAYAGRRDPYDVLLVQRDGTSTSFRLTADDLGLLRLRRGGLDSRRARSRPTCPRGRW